jgi:hypothetical protein
MKKLITLLAAAAVLALTLAAQAADTRCYEMRTYYAAPGKLADLQARFRDHTCKLFEKHGMVNVGYWVPLDNAENKLVYLLAYPSREAREVAWKAFGADPAWQAARKASEANGKLVTKADVQFLQATDFSPEIKPSTAAANRVFELRQYTATPGQLDALLGRFRNHTCKLFEKHGMTNFGYWTPAPKEKGAENMLVYLLIHQSRAAATNSFAAFRADPAWMDARKASEEKAGGSLTVKDGVKSEYLTATDFSATR